MHCGLHLVPHPAVLELFAWCKRRSPRWFLEKTGECVDGTIEYDYYIVVGAVKKKIKRFVNLPIFCGKSTHHTTSSCRNGKETIAFAA